jgi:hypothetical protein
VKKLVLWAVCVLAVACGESEERAELFVAPESDAGQLEQDASAPADAVADGSANVAADAGLQALAADASVPTDGDSGTGAESQLVADAGHLAPRVTFADLKAVTDQKCASCHALSEFSDRPNGPLPWLADTHGLGVAFPTPGSGSNSATCAGWSYIVPGHPEQSLLYAKLTASSPCGAHPVMPSPPTEEQVALVSDAMRDWVN